MVLSLACFSVDLLEAFCVQEELILIIGKVNELLLKFLPLIFGLLELQKHVTSLVIILVRDQLGLRHCLD